MTELIREQILEVTVMFGAGISVAFFYNIFRLTCRTAGAGKVIRGVIEIIFWIASALWTSEFLYYCAYGKISFHAGLGFAGGVILWQICFCDIIDKMYRCIKNKQRLKINYGKKKKKQSV